MARMSLRHHRLRGFLLPATLAALGGLLALGACMSELPEVGPLSDIGVVEGRIVESALGVAATVKFIDATDNDTEANITALADSTGWYRVELPVGLYRVRLGMSGNSVQVSSDADTVMVGRCVRRRDFTRIRAQVTVTLPPEYESTSAYLSADRPGMHGSARVRVVDGTAAFDLRLLPPAKYTMRFRANDYYGTFLLPGTNVAADADSLDARADPAAYAIDLRPRHASISGHVTGSWQRTQDAMHVNAVTLDWGTDSEVECATDGSFRIDTLMPEPIKLCARHNGVENWYGGTSRATATVFDLQPGDHLDGMDLEEGGLDIRFEGPGQMVPVEHSVILHREVGDEITLVRMDGDPVRVTNLQAGRYLLQVGGYCFQEPWQPRWYDDTAVPGEAVPIDIVAGSVQSITMVLRAGGSISGRITREDGETPYAYNVIVGDGAGADLCERTIYTDRDRLLVEGLPDGQYCLSFYDGTGRWWYPGTRNLAQATRLVISGGNAVGDLVWPVHVAAAAGGAR